MKNEGAEERAKLTIRLDRVEKKKLDIALIEDDLTLQEMVEGAIAEYLEKREDGDYSTSDRLKVAPPRPGPDEGIIR
jgi:hypothetical protein